MLRKRSKYTLSLVVARPANIIAQGQKRVVEFQNSRIDSGNTDMCEWGNTVELRVPIPSEDSHTGRFRWAKKPVDRCIADFVQALNDARIHTRSCCCGHGEKPGSILLHDGRKIFVRKN